MEIGNLPDGWRWVKLGSITRVVVGYVGPISKDYTDEQNGVPLLSTTNISVGGFVHNEKKFVSREFHNRNKKSQARPGDILIARHGTSGASVIVPEFFPECQVLNAVIVRKTDSLSSRFITYFMNLKAMTGGVDNSKTGSVQAIINTSVIKDMLVLLPPLDEQQRIVSRIEELFSDLEAGVAALERVRAGLKRYKVSVLKAAVEGNLFGNVEMGDDGLLPGWTRVTIDDVAESLDNKRVPVNKKEREQRQGKYPYYGANGQVDWIDDYIFDEPLVLVVEDETFTGREKPFSYKITGKTWVNNHAHVLRAKENILDVDYLNYSLAYYPFTPMTTGTTGRKKLTKSVLMAAPYLLPPLEEQRRIVAEVERRLSVVGEVESAVEVGLARSARLRQAVLRSAFEGRL